MSHSQMMLSLYKAATIVAAPLLALALTTDRRRRPLLARFHPSLPHFDAAPLWVHACSVGEVNTARPILEALHQTWPDRPLLLTVSTPTGKALAESADPPAEIAWFPFDHPLIVRRFLRHCRPHALILIETELWPTVITQAHAQGAAIVLVNGRLSDGQDKAYRRFRPFLQPAAALITSAGMQNAIYAERLCALGAAPERVTITGNTKFDSAPPQMSSHERAALRAELSIPPDAPLLVFGSTRPGDEALAAQCWRNLTKRFPKLKMIVAPRHLDRVDEAKDALDVEDLRLRSTLSAQGPQDDAASPIILLDTHGELARIYALADVAIVGGSFYPGVDGHNPIEPAAQGIATVFGPFMRNVQDSAIALLNSEGAVQVSTPDALCAELEALLSDEDARAQMGRNALQCVHENQGATQRTLDLIQRALKAR